MFLSESILRQYTMANADKCEFYQNLNQTNVLMVVWSSVFLSAMHKLEMYFP